MVKAKKWILATKFDGEPKDSNFKLEEEDLPALKDGEFICDAVYLSVDPYMRAHVFPVGSVIIGEQVARVTESKSKDYPVGCLVQMYAGWRSRTLVDPKNLKAMETLLLLKVPDLGKLAPSLALGVLGMPGMTAYFGFLELCQPKAGETVLVNGAAGAVGSAVGQIAKIKGCKVIGFAGSKEKCDWVKSLGFDHVFNYKEADISKSLKEAAPDGIDCYFDNVGGDFTSKALQHMKLFGRISVCGGISIYNATQPRLTPDPFMTILSKQLKVEGFIVMRWWAKYPEGKADMKKWIDEGKIKYRETVKDGFENMPQIFMSLLKGANIGKMIVKA
ncbi:prostaglandin reductase 1-like [Haliotis rufescens]|uniref:prostaglandin reductase 1-like n=1 Tax=Haliotis rufescens TaxID=6454 RepID=UPI00201E9EA9|nr:prostaglandin reductase 1-like [Haliotis rufescens]